MKLLQVIIFLCLFILLICSESRDILMCAVDNISQGLADNFMKLYNQDPDTGFFYFMGNTDSVSNAINSCL